MYSIFEDDYAYTNDTVNDSDGVVELCWDHPSYPKQWCARHASSYGRLKEKKPEPFTKITRYLDYWPYDILLKHFSLTHSAFADAPEEVLRLSPERLNELKEHTPEIRKQDHKTNHIYQHQPHISQKLNEQKEIKPILGDHGKEEKDNQGKSEATQLLSVFLCHSSTDKPAVRELYHRLINAKIDPWLDEEKILPGQNWEREIEKAVRSADVIIVCLSCSSIRKVGYLQKEIKYALDIADEQPEGAIFLIPLKLEECEILERLRHLQWVDYFAEDGFKRLMDALRGRTQDLGICVGPTGT